MWPKLCLFPQCHVHIFTWMFVSTFLLQSATVTYRYWLINSGFSRAHINYVYETVKICSALFRPLRVELGQYIYLWIPTASFWSFLQSHPFTVTSWSEEKQTSLDLLVEPHREITRRLIYQSKAAAKASRSIMHSVAFFTGPHGASASAGKQEKVLIVASGFCIATQLPYLKKLIYGYNACTTRTLRVRLVSPTPVHVDFMLMGRYRNRGADFSQRHSSRRYLG